MNLGASQVVPVVKNLPANAGDIRDLSSIPGSGDPLAKSMRAHSNILACRIPMDRGAWRTAVHGAAESDTTEQPSAAQNKKAYRDRKEVSNHLCLDRKARGMTKRSGVSLLG